MLCDNRSPYSPAKKCHVKLTASLAMVIMHLSAQWSFENGCLGSLVHGAVLQGRRYEASLDVWADGLRMALEDPYSEKCTLRIRRGIIIIICIVRVYKSMHITYV